MGDEIVQAATLEPFEPRPFFLHPLMSYRHRICFDLRDDSCLGFVRALWLGEDEDGSFVYVLSMQYGRHIRTIFPEEDIGYLDFHEAILLTTDELLDELNECQLKFEFYDYLFGEDDAYTAEVSNSYQWLQADLIQIMCVNHCYSRHNYDWLRLQHYMAQIPLPETATL